MGTRTQVLPQKNNKNSVEVGQGQPYRYNQI